MTTTATEGPSEAELRERLEVAVDAARAAGALLLDYQRRGLTVTTKTTATDPVSEADHASEVLVLERLGAAFPDDGMLGEEAEGNRDGTSGLRWVIDPLDGTVNYLYGLPAWCVSIGLEDLVTGEPVLGVVHHPGARETFTAIAGLGAWVLAEAEAVGAGTPLRVSSPASPAMALVATGYAYDAEVRIDQARRVAALAGQVRDIRRAGAAALDLAWTAAGRLDAYGEHDCKPWDWMAGLVLVREAGGIAFLRDHVIAGRTLRGVFAGDPATLDVLLSHFD